MNKQIFQGVNKSIQANPIKAVIVPLSAGVVLGHLHHK